MPRDADVIVVGAGVHGASLAFNLLRMEAGRVLLLDKANVGAGASGRSASFLRHHYSNRICVKVVKESLRILRNFADEVGGEVDFQPQPLLLLADAPNERALRENVAMHRQEGVGVRLMEPTEAHETFPFLDLTGVVLAALEEDAGYGDAYQVNAEYASRFRALGGELMTDTEVHSVDVEGEGVVGVNTSRGRIGAEQVVIATGPWSAGLVENAGVALPVEPALLSVGILQPPRDIRSTPMAFDMATTSYWRPERNGTLLVGTDEEVEGSWDPDGLPDGVSFEFVSSVSERLGRRWPEMGEAHFVRGWVGVDGATPDLHPIIGALPPIEGLFATTGYSGHGFKFSPAVGKCLAELIVEGRYRTLDLSPFALDRFERGETFKSRYPMAVVQ